MFAVGAQDLGVSSGLLFEVTPLGPKSPELWYFELRSGLIQVENSIFRLGCAPQQDVPCWETAS